MIVAIPLPTVGRYSVAVGHRLIAAGDELALTGPELAIMADCAPEVRRRSGAARIVARDLLVRLGGPPSDLVRSRRQPPRWPDGFVGSLAHDGRVAVAVVGRADAIAALGIDVEPDEPLQSELVEFVATPAERRRYTRSILGGRDLLVAKEAVYKATVTLDGDFLDFHDIEVDLAGGIAVTVTGRAVSLFLAAGAHKVAVAIVEKHAATPRGRRSVREAILHRRENVLE